MDLVEEEVHGVKRAARDKADQRARVVNQVLDWVHRQAGPGPGVFRLVVRLVHVLVDELAWVDAEGPDPPVLLWLAAPSAPVVHKAVYEVEVPIAPKRNENELRDRPVRTLAEQRRERLALPRRHHAADDALER